MATGPSQAYDPRVDKASCDACPLQRQTPLAPQPAKGKASLVIITETPSRSCQSIGQLLSGEQGKVFNRSLTAAAVNRQDTHVTALTLCRVSKDLTTDEVKLARACCRPRLQHEISKVDDRGWIVTMGSAATEAITGLRGKVEKWAGGPLTSTLFPNKQVIATYSPETLAKPKYRAYSAVYVAHLKRANQLATGLLSPWVWPETVVDPGPAMKAALRRILKDAQWAKPIGVDIETTGIDPRTSEFRCIGLATLDLAVSVPTPYSDVETGQLVHEILNTVAPKIWQNGNFDRQGFRAQGIMARGPHEDTLLLHAIAAPQLLHGLGFLAGAETHAENWKAAYHSQDDDKGVSKWKTTSEEELREMRVYNARDAYMQRWLYDPLSVRVQRDVPHGPRLYGEMKDLAEICMEMSWHGIQQNKPAVERWQKVLGEELEVFKDRIAFAANKIGYPDLNPGSNKQLQDLYFNYFRLTPVRFSKETGKPSLNSEALSEYQFCGNQTAEAFSEALLAYREKAKLLSTYVRGEDEEDEDSGERRRGLNASEDGRYHANWKSFGTVTWRFASSPNCYSGDTEVLTPAGWIRFDCYIPGTPIAQWDDGKITFVVPSNYVTGAGTLHHIKTRAIDLLVSDNHRCLVETRAGDHKVIDQKDFVNDRKHYHAGNFQWPGSIELTPEQLALIVATQADGHITKTAVEFAFSKTRKVVRLLKLLQGLGVVCRHNYDAKRNRYRIRFNRKMAPWIETYLDKATKTFSWDLLKMSAECAERFVEELWLWDGLSTRKNNYASANKANRDFAQTMMVLTNRRARGRTYVNSIGSVSYQIDVCSDTNYSWTTNFTRKTSEGQWYGVTVPSSFHLVRRSNCVSVSGNCQNIPNGIESSVARDDKGEPVVLGNMRDIFCATPGLVMAGADQSQLEARIAALFAGADKMLEWYADGQDVHLLTAQAIFDDPKMTKKDPRRNLVKNAVYASLYGASDETVWRTLRKQIATKPGESGITLRQAVFLKDSFFKQHPQFPAWHQRQISNAKRDMKITEPFSGSEVNFYGYVDPSVAINFPCQRMGAWLVNGAIVEIQKELNPDEHFLLNCHDELVYEGPDGERLKKLLTKHMQKDVDYCGRHVSFVVEPKSGPTWADCK